MIWVHNLTTCNKPRWSWRSIWVHQHATYYYLSPNWRLNQFYLFLLLRCEIQARERTQRWNIPFMRFELWTYNKYHTLSSHPVVSHIIAPLMSLMTNIKYSSFHYETQYQANFFKNLNEKNRWQAHSTLSDIQHIFFVSI